MIGYTGQFTAEQITKSLPTDLRWAIAGRSRDKLEQTVASLALLDPDRRPPGNYALDKGIFTADLSQELRSSI